MTHDSHLSPIFRIDVSAEAPPDAPEFTTDDIVIALLRQIADGQERQVKLLEQLNEQICATQKQRHAELEQWKNANPRLARRCRQAAESLNRVQAEFLRHLTDEIQDNEELLTDGEFMLNEFVDRFGPRMAQLNGMLQVLSQLSAVSMPAGQELEEE